MRAKRAKRYRKIMNIYSLTFSFRKPYQILLDAAFIRACHAFHMPLRKSLESTLHGECAIFITNCTLQKIKAEQAKITNFKGRPDFLPPPTELPLRHCKHNEKGDPIAEVDCLTDLLAGSPKGNELPKNRLHFVLATADAAEADARARSFIDIRDVARRVPGVPMVYVKRSVMVLEEPSNASLGVRTGAEREKLKEGLLGAADRKRKRADDEQGESKSETTETMTQLKKKSTAKGQPNPLSIKKKREKPEQRLAQEAVIFKSKRKRKHSSHYADGEGTIGEAASPNSVTI